ncbi:MAG: VTT domain-containing protein [bacterium]
MHLFDVQYLIQSVGLLGIFAIVFAESGLFFAFFLPGDSLLFTAGFLASQNMLPIFWLILGIAICAVLAGYAGYYFGQWIGPKIFVKEDSLFFRKKYLNEAHAFFEKYGNKAVVLARFIPIIRTFTPILAGVGRMTFANFSFYNIFGGSLWAVGITLIGYYLGHLIPGVQDYLFPIALLIIFISALPGVYEYLLERKKRKR